MTNQLFKAEYLLIWLLLILITFFSVVSIDFRNVENLMEILRSCSLTALMVLGVTWIIASGEMDVSFPNIAAFASIVTAVCIKNDISWGFTVIIAPLSAVPLGLLCAVLINRFKFPALIASIDIAAIATSVASMFNKGQPIYLTNMNSVIEFIIYGKFVGVPVLFIIVLLIYAGAKWVQDYSTFGQHLYALGENRTASLEAGIDEKKIIIWSYILAAFLAGISGVLLAASFSSGQPRIGGSFFIDGFTAVFLGAMMIKIGKPNLIGTLFGAIIIAVLTNGITMLGIPYFIGSIIKGILMVIGVGVIVYNRPTKI